MVIVWVQSNSMVIVKIVVALFLFLAHLPTLCMALIIQCSVWATFGPYWLCCRRQGEFCIWGINFQRVCTIIVSLLQLFTGVPGSRFTNLVTRVIPEDNVLKKTLFGALTHSTSTDINDPLGLPYLPSDHTHLSLLPRVGPIGWYATPNLIVPSIRWIQSYPWLPPCCHLPLLVTMVTMAPCWHWQLQVKGRPCCGLGRDGIWGREGRECHVRLE